MLIVGTTDVRYLRSDMPDGRYRCPILRILRLLCLHCKFPFTLRTSAARRRQKRRTSSLADIHVVGGEATWTATLMYIHRHRALQVLNYMLLTVVVNGHTCIQLLPRDTRVLKHTSVLMLPTLPAHAQRVCGPPMMIFASAGDVMLPPSLVVPSLGTTNDGSG